MLTHHTHPTVDTIYNDLIDKMPTLSKTTIYNTLKLLDAHGAIKELTIDKKTAHYDGIIEPHSHFMCKCCGKIIDIPQQKVDDRLIKHDFIVEEEEVYYRGYCKECSKNRTDLQ